MLEDPKWELALLATMQAFYQRLLGEHLGGQLPAPAGLTPDAITRSSDVHVTLRQMHLWIQLLDMAITPAMLRVAMTTDLDAEVAEALLRYLVRHRDDSASNRDKTDLVATFLFRHPRVPGQWERRGYGLDGSIPLSPFEIALLEILSESDVPVLPEEHVQLLREFGPLLEQATRFQNFGALMDSGIIQRVRELKASLGESIYHPGVLATLAPYNAAFGERFHVLFSSAAHEIKDFARQLEQLGGSILSNVDGVEVTVEHIASLDEAALLKFDYTAALDKFRRVSRLKKELERRPPIRRSQKVTPTTPSRSERVVGRNGAAAAPARVPQYTPAAITHAALTAEEAKIRRVQESIRIFVRVADAKVRQMVPMRYFNLALTPVEVEAYTADYLEEASVRAETARSILRIVAVTARMTTEMEEMKRAPRGSSVWKLHADALNVLIELTKKLFSSIGPVQKSGSAKDSPVSASLAKVRAKVSEVEKAFAAV